MLGLTRHDYTEQLITNTYCILHILKKKCHGRK
jgi:hypothetical protein